MEKICVYTCITGNYDDLQEIKNKEPGIDYYCFTNNNNIKSNTWNVVYIEDNNLDNTRLARKIKVLGHPLISENYDISIWVDGFISEMHINDFIHNECQLDKYDFICFKHSKRNCIYEEAKECINQGKDDPELIKKEIEFLKKENYPKNNGLIESTVLIRKHNIESVKNTMSIWFDMILNYSKRDQLSLNYAIYKVNPKVQIVDLNVFDNKYFIFLKHKNLAFDKIYTIYYDTGSGFNENSRSDLLYVHENGNLIIELELKQDVNRIRIDLCEMQGVLLNIKKLKNIDVNNISFVDWLKVDDQYVSLSDPQIIINDIYKKGDKISLKINLSLVDNDTLYEIMYNNIQNYIFENKKLNLDICNLKNINSDLSLKNKKITEKCNEITKKYDDIINSKRWKLVSKINLNKGDSNEKK